MSFYNVLQLCRGRPVRLSETPNAVASQIHVHVQFTHSLCRVCFVVVRSVVRLSFFEFFRVFVLQIYIFNYVEPFLLTATY